MNEIITFITELVAFVGIFGTVIIGITVLIYVYKPTKNKNNGKS